MPDCPQPAAQRVQHHPHRNYYRFQHPKGDCGIRPHRRRGGVYHLCADCIPPVPAHHRHSGAAHRHHVLERLAERPVLPHRHRMVFHSAGAAGHVLPDHLPVKRHRLHPGVNRDIPTTTIRMAIAVVAIAPILIAYPFSKNISSRGLRWAL